MGVAEQTAAGTLEFLARVRAAERRLVGRTLHDEVGPSLCSAGLILGLLRESGGETAELAHSAARALEQAVTAVRALSYSADPALAMRCGLKSALQSIAATLAADFESTGAPPWDDATSAAAFETVRALLLITTSTRPHVLLSDAGIEISPLPPLGLPLPTTPGLRITHNGGTLKIEAGGTA